MPDEIRLLARNSTFEHPALGVGYTDRPGQALRHEPEAISLDAQAELALRSQLAARAAQLDEWRARRAAVARELDCAYPSAYSATSGRSFDRQRQLDRLDAKLTT